MADTPALGAGARKGVEVRVLFSAPTKGGHYQVVIFFVGEYNNTDSVIQTQ